MLLTRFHRIFRQQAPHRARACPIPEDPLSQTLRPGLPALRRLLTRAFGEREDVLRVGAMMGLFFLVICAVGILRPIKNALALDGLADSEFYKVYFVSAAVVLFVPPYNRIADRISWTRLIPAVALFLAANLVLFRLLYRDGSATFGMLFYGWYDLFAAALVTQFFMATQLLFDARESKRVYPVVIAGGAMGATLGGAITGFFAERVGTPNLLLVAAALICVFGVGLPLVWPNGRAPERPRRERPRGSVDEIADIARNRQVRLIAGSVLLMVLVKQLVDYEFNTLSERVFVTRDAVSAFQGKFNAATQWLPILGVLALRPVLRRWGVGVAVLMLPGLLLGSNVALAITWSLWAAAAAKTADTSLRYSAERAAREILYVPVPEDIRLRAKAYIDVAVEKGFGKALSGLLIMGCLAVLPPRGLPFVAVALAAAWLATVVSIRREYVAALAASIRGRFQSLQHLFAGVADANTQPLLRRALGGGDRAEAAFALDLVDQMSTGDAREFRRELNALLEHESEAIRARALEVLTRHHTIAHIGRVKHALTDVEPGVRAAAVRVLYSASVEHRAGVIAELLGSPDPRVRTAVLSCIASGQIAREHAAGAGAAYLSERRLVAAADPDARVELALAAGTLDAGDAAVEILEPFLDDADPRVAAAALRAAGLLGTADLYPRLIEGLAPRGTREAAREALVQQGGAAVGVLTAALLDTRRDPRIRRAIPYILSRIPSQAAVDALLISFLAPETDQLLDFRTVRALSSLRAHYPELTFDTALVHSAVDREIDAARRYDAARAAVARITDVGLQPRVQLLDRALAEAMQERREGVFRCLGLIHDPEPMHRCFLATGGNSAPRANALEWLEQTLGYVMFRRLAPVLPGEPVAPIVNDFDLTELCLDGDPWVACCARCATAPGIVNRDSGDLDMDLLEKVFLLQRVDLLRDARTAHVALIASIAEDMHVEAGTELLRQGEPTDALYAVLQGGVQLRGIADEWLLAGPGDSFGSWALIDEAPSVVGAVAAEPSRLLRICRNDFFELLDDNPELAVGLLQGLARRVRALVA